MAVGRNMVPDFVVNGSYGELIADVPGSGLGNGAGPIYLAQVQKCDAKIVKSKQDIHLGGTRHTFRKLMAVSGEGTISQFRVTDHFFAVIANVMHSREGIPNATSPNGVTRDVFSNVDYKTTLQLNYDDPEGAGVSSFRLNGVRFWEIGLGFSVNEMVMEEVPFTFESIDILHAVYADIFSENYAARYTAQVNNLNPSSGRI